MNKECLSEIPVEELEEWLKEITWEEFWAVADMLINWDEKREELAEILKHADTTEQ